eukprot:5776802-Pyramimonas_sp.AAC.1
MLLLPSLSRLFQSVSARSPSMSCAFASTTKSTTMSRPAGTTTRTSSMAAWVIASAASFKDSKT